MEQQKNSWSEKSLAATEDAERRRIVEQMAELHAESVGLKINQLARKLYLLIEGASPNIEEFQEELMKSIEDLKRGRLNDSHIDAAS